MSDPRRSSQRLTAAVSTVSATYGLRRRNNELTTVTVTECSAAGDVTPSGGVTASRSVTERYPHSPAGSSDPVCCARLRLVRVAAARWQTGRRSRRAANNGPPQPSLPVTAPARRGKLLIVAGGTKSYNRCPAPTAEANAKPMVNGGASGGGGGSCRSASVSGTTSCAAGDPGWLRLSRPSVVSRRRRDNSQAAGPAAGPETVAANDPNWTAESARRSQ